MEKDKKSIVIDESHESETKITLGDGVVMILSYNDDDKQKLCNVLIEYRLEEDHPQLNFIILEAMQLQPSSYKINVIHYDKKNYRHDIVVPQVQLFGEMLFLSLAALGVIIRSLNHNNIDKTDTEKRLYHIIHMQAERIKQLECVADIPTNTPISKD